MLDFIFSFQTFLEAGRPLLMRRVLRNPQVIFKIRLLVGGVGEVATTVPIEISWLSKQEKTEIIKLRYLQRKLTNNFLFHSNKSNICGFHFSIIVKCQNKYQAKNL